MYRQIEKNRVKTVLLFSLLIIFVLLAGYIFGRAAGCGFWGLILAFVVSILMSFGSYYYCDRIVMAMSRAREIQESDNPELFHTVENICIGAGIPKPRIYIIDDPSPNAFATGRNPEHSAIAVTSGLLQMLNRTELEGVISHEISHVKSYDILIATLVVVMLGMIVLLSDFFLRFMLFGDEDRDSRTVGVIFLVIGVILALLAPLIAILIQMAISRKREFLADANGALITRYPEGLASALEKIDRDTHPLRVVNKATAHLFIANPLKEHGGFLNKLFSTHPPIEERVKALREMSL